MHQYRRYAEDLRGLAQLWSVWTASPDKPRLERALNGEAAQILAERVPVDVLRRAGAFFTPQALAEKLEARLASVVTSGGVVLDPACGAGDLLLVCARRLPIARSLEATVEAWGRQLHGFDIHSEFITATKARLILLAIARGARGRLLQVDVDDVFPNIRRGDFLATTRLESVPDCIIVNPPFQRVKTPRGITWGTGLVTQAAVFIDKCTSLVPTGTRIAALLPDVLRSGSRYGHWRRLVRCRASVKDIEQLGVFSANADVDVFLVTLTRRDAERQAHTVWLPADASQNDEPILGSRCRVRVGPVVPFRDKLVGSFHPYVTTAVLPPWGTTKRVGRRRYDGETFKTPFVAVRRTSRANDHHRAVATIVQHSRRVAVENHVVVLLPNNPTMEECQYLLSVLRDPRTTDWLNKRICCRHLTTSVLKELPLWSSNGR
jgi:hypothetical protein